MTNINPVFFDWVSGFFKVKNNPHILNEIVGMLNHSTGEVSERKWIKPTKLEGTYSDKMQVKGIDSETIYLSGNPTKFLQGHNIIGSSSIVDLISGVYDKLKELDGIYLDDFDYQKLKNGDFRLSRLDITSMYDINGSNLAVNEFLKAMEYQSRVRSGRAVYAGNTLYFGKHSRRWSIKFYNKFEELKTHKTSIIIPKNIIDWVKGKVRIELTIRGQELKYIGLEKGKTWVETPSKIDQLFFDYLGKIKLGENNMKHIDEETLSKLKPRHLAVYQAWISGFDLSKQYPRKTFYRYRKEIEEAIGVDITERCPEPPKAGNSNVIPLVRIITAKPASVPHDIFKGYVVGY